MDQQTPCPITPQMAPAAFEFWDRDFFLEHNKHIDACPECQAEAQRILAKQKENAAPVWLRTASQIASVVLLGFHFGFFRRR